MNKKEVLKQAVLDKKLVKIIAGIDNFDIDKVKQIVTAAEKGGANAVDVSAGEDIIKTALETTSLPVFVSSIYPEELAMAANLGADALEIGNFDALYKKGLRISPEEVFEIVEKTYQLAGRDIFLSVTVPGHIEIIEQIKLAQKLEEIGVDLIQTEGAAIVDAEFAGARGLVQKATVSLANTIELVKNTSIPVMTASGITPTIAPLAFAAGACGIGVGSCVNRLNSTLEMTAAVMAVVESVKTENSQIPETV